VSASIPLPVAFDAFVYFDFDKSCLVKRVTAFANIPTRVLGKAINLPGLPLRSIFKGVAGHGNFWDGIFEHGIL